MVEVHKAPGVKQSIILGQPQHWRTAGKFKVQWAPLQCRYLVGGDWLLNQTETLYKVCTRGRNLKHNTAAVQLISVSNPSPSSFIYVHNDSPTWTIYIQTLNSAFKSHNYKTMRKWAWGGLTLAFSTTYSHTWKTRKWSHADDAHDTWSVLHHMPIQYIKLMSLHAASPVLPARGSCSYLNLFISHGRYKNLQGCCWWLCQQGNHWSSSHAVDSNFPLHKNGECMKNTHWESKKHHKNAPVKWNYTVRLLCIKQ